MNREPYSKLDFGTNITTDKLEKIDVTIDPNLILSDFAKAYLSELQRRNSIRAKSVAITEAELKEYFISIIAIRVQSVRGNCPVWREAKALFIPTWIEFVITEIGEVVDVDRGLLFTPVFEHQYDIKKLLATSDKLRAFRSDGVSMSKDAFPRKPEGDYETMSMVIINDYVQSISKDSHPIASYVAAFLGFKLKEEASFKMLYRIRYDDVDFIRTMLLREESLF